MPFPMPSPKPDGAAFPRARRKPYPTSPPPSPEPPSRAERETYTALMERERNDACRRMAVTMNRVRSLRALVPALSSAASICEAAGASPEVRAICEAIDLIGRAEPR